MTTAELPIIQLRLADIKVDGGTQPRVKIEDKTVADYAENIDELPPADVFWDGTCYWLADGFIRFRAHQKKNRRVMDCRKHLGTLRDAILFAVHANARHGVRLTDSDKWNICRMLLADKEWGRWSDREIARQGNVSNHLVAKVRRVLKEEAKKQREKEKEAAKKAADKAKKKEEEKAAADRAKTRGEWKPPGKVDGSAPNDEPEDVRQFRSRHGTTGTRKVKSERGAVRIERDPDKRQQRDGQGLRSLRKGARQGKAAGWDDAKWFAECRAAWDATPVATE